MEPEVNQKRSVECTRCEGLGRRGKYSCAKCGGRGILTRERILQLRDEYWPKKVATQEWGEKAAAEQIADLNADLQRLDGVAGF